MIIVNKELNKDEMIEIAARTFGEMTKGVVDVNQKILAIDADLHADLEELLLDQGSLQQNLWGINIYPELEGNDAIEFDSLINIRPKQNNRSRGVEDENVQKQIMDIVHKWVKL